MPVSKEQSDSDKLRDSLPQAHSMSNPEEVRQCFFRKYPPHRYYYSEQASELPPFLSTSEYIRGKAPIILNTEPPKKICVDEPWEIDRFDWRLPFSDGFNPSIVSLSSAGLTSIAIAPLQDFFGREAVDGMFIAFLRFGDSFCSYRDNDKTKEMYNLSTHRWLGLGERRGLEPTIAVILDSKLEWVAQSIVMVELDADFGVGKENGGRVDVTKMQKLSGSGGKYKFVHVAKRLDDIRVFVNQGFLWISYYGPDYGFDNGNIVMNKVHFDRSPKDSSKVYLYIRASEVEVACCGVSL